MEYWLKHIYIYGPNVTVIYKKSNKEFFFCHRKLDINDIYDISNEEILTMQDYINHMYSKICEKNL
jgi:hypothetical protein